MFYIGIVVGIFIGCIISLFFTGSKIDDLVQKIAYLKDKYNIKEDIE